MGATTLLGFIERSRWHESSQLQAMIVKYFRDTDTALLEFSRQPVEETRDISENIYIDLDPKGKI